MKKIKFGAAIFHFVIHAAVFYSTSLYIIISRVSIGRDKVLIVEILIVPDKLKFAVLPKKYYDVIINSYIENILIY